MDLQPTFIKNIQATYKEAGKIWLAQLPAHIEDLSQQWNFRFIRPFPDLSYSFVGLVKLNTNHELAIIKIAPDPECIMNEAHWLQCFESSVPKIYDIDEKKCAVLMEYLHPGQPLKTLVQNGQDEAATKIICQIILQLQSKQQKSVANFKHLAELIPDLAYLKNHVDDRVLSKAQSLFRDLTADRTHDVLLHGDLHHDNIISHGDSWKVIDPHGYIGDPVAEVGAMIRNPYDCFPKEYDLAAVIEKRLKILAEHLPFDPKKIKAWAYCMTLLSAAWNVEDFGTAAKKEIQMAAIVDRLKG